MSLVFPPLYAIIDAALLKTSELSFAEMMAESGVELLQYRNKRASSRQLFEVSQSISVKLSAAAQEHVQTRSGEVHSAAPQGKLRFIVNDRADIALLVNAGGVHVGQEDLRVEEARGIVGAKSLGGRIHAYARAAGRRRQDFRRLHRLRPDFSYQLPRRIPIPWWGWICCGRRARHTRKPLVAIGGHHARARRRRLPRGSRFAGRDARTDCVRRSGGARRAISGGGRAGAAGVRQRRSSADSEPGA